MLDFTSFLSSKARLDVLRVLVHQPSPLPLRRIATLADSLLFSVQRALAQLAKDKILIRQKKGRYVFFSINKHHPFYSFLIRFLDLEMKARLAFLAKRYCEKAQSSLDFSDGARELFKGVRR